jgi:hypothetical protein
MSPRLLAKVARERGIGILALTDHNAALNCPAFSIACGREGVVPLFGVEASSLEEVHVLCIFGTVEQALDFGELLKARLPRSSYDPAKLGDQAVVDADDDVLELPDYYLGGATQLGFDELCLEAARRRALVIPAHVDRPMFSVSSQLGFLPAGPYDAVEAIREPPESLRRGLPLVSGSDAHYPEHIGRRAFALDLQESLIPAPGQTGPLDRGFPAQALLEGIRAALPGAEPSWMRQR